MLISSDNRCHCGLTCGKNGGGGWGGGGGGGGGALGVLRGLGVRGGVGGSRRANIEAEAVFLREMRIYFA